MKKCFAIKLVVGIISLLSFFVYAIAGLPCLVASEIGAIFMLSSCNWENRLSGFIPAIMFFVGSVLFNGHLFTQLVCIIFMVFGIVVGVQLNGLKNKSNTTTLGSFKKNGSLGIKK